MRFCFTKEEDKIGCSCLVRALLASFCSRFRINLSHRVTGCCLDGDQAGMNLLAQHFPAARVFRCLQHVKKNVVKHAREARKDTRAR